MQFFEHHPSTETLWRSIILFGRNVASYKFSLGRSLLDLAEAGSTSVTLEQLAVPFSGYICDHLKMNDRQGTSGSSRFLDACRQYNTGEISLDQLRDETVRRGFNNVIDAFHVVNRQEIPQRFFMDERGGNGGLTLTDDLLALKGKFQFSNLPLEVESRWKLVETAWNLNISPRLLQVQADAENEILFIEMGQRRRDLSTSRDSLNGYQKGKCFYSFEDISLDRESPNFCDVDHFFPHTLKQFSEFAGVNLDGVWNLVLSSRACNRGGEIGKFARLPALKCLERLHRRNNFLIDSHHPLRETLMNQTGKTESHRQRFLQQVYNMAKERLIHNWMPQTELEPLF